MHLSCCVLGLYVPAAHAVCCVLPAVAKYPTVAGVHSEGLFKWVELE